MRRATQQPGQEPGRALPADLTEAITRAGYYPSLVVDVVESAIAGDEVVSHLVHQETTFDSDTVRRHVTVLVITPDRLVIAHADDHPEMSSVELNPVNAWTGGVDVLGADVVVRPALVRKDPGRRRMT